MNDHHNHTTANRCPDMAWLRRPKFFDDGSFTLEKVRQAESVQVIGVLSHEEFIEFWKPVLQIR